MRQFVATGFVVEEGKTLLLFHKKLRMWLPPGGHIDPGETPDDAVLREIREETGLLVEIIPEREGAPRLASGPLRLQRPRVVQLEDIPDPKGFHQHIDLIYFCRPIGGRLAPAESELDELRWFTRADLLAPAVSAEVRETGLAAIEALS